MIGLVLNPRSLSIASRASYWDCYSDLLPFKIKYQGRCQNSTSQKANLTESSPHPNLMSCGMGLQVGKRSTELQSTTRVSWPCNHLTFDLS